jgi:GNAT superfamily N-acetyltransferase
MQLRAADPTEAPHLSSLAFEAKAALGYSPVVMESWRPQLAVSGKDILSHPTVVADLGQQIAGFYQLRFALTYWMLEHLWVRFERQRQGIGSGLLNHAMQFVAGQSGAYIEIVSEPSAAGFYEHHGARRAGKTPAPMPGQHDRSLPLYVLDVRAPGS